MISFILYFHSSRLDNLSQTLRFLTKREPKLADAEVILVCQDRCAETPECHWDTKLVNLNSDSYCKPIMCNVGVLAAKYPVIALLDSDRVLGQGYFTNILSKASKGFAYTTRYLYKNIEAATDGQIEANEQRYEIENRSPENALRMKNLFSGNTVMMKEDYLRCNGMDLSYVGYGIADNDMTRNVENNDILPVFVNEPEVHLFHPAEIYWRGEILDFLSLQVFTAINGIKYCLKWHIEPSQSFIDLVIDCNSNVMQGKVNHMVEDIFVKFLYETNNLRRYAKLSIPAKKIL